jgi:hypothetical protein
MWNQIKDANWKVPYTGGWCLKYVQDAFGTDHPYPSAMAAWNANFSGGNHTDLPPVGKTVAVYFSLGNVPEGHVAISLDDGTVASSTQAGTHPQGYLHPNLNNLISVYGQYNGGCHYLGWSEFVGTVQVVQQQITTATDDQIRQDYLDILERPVDDGALAHYRSFTNDFVRADLLASNEYKLVQARHAADAAKAIADKAAADAEAARVAKAAADAQAAAQAETDRLAKVAADKVAADAETARLKALQDAADAKKLADAQLADIKARADTVAVQASKPPTQIYSNIFSLLLSALLSLLRKVRLIK